MKRSTRGLALALLLAATAQAQDSEDEELEALLALLDEETEIATQTRLNADYVPGVVTVLRGEDVAALGARHVLDALALVPGIEALRDDIGNATLRVRGIDYFENSGQVKVLVNGLSFARETAGQNGSVMLMPIEMVDRIEVIRGPGSEVYGDFAFAGLVNIITKEDRSLVYAQGGGGGLQSAGFNLSHQSGESFKVNLGFSRFVADDLEAATSTSFADEERYFGHFNLYYNNFSLKLAAVDRSAIQSGARNVLRPREDEGLAVEMRYRWTAGTVLEMQSWINYADNDMQNNNTLFFEGSRRELGTSANWSRGKHRFLAQASYGRRDYESRILPPPTPGMPPLPGQMGRELTDRDRTVASASLQDEIELGTVTVTLGARYDWLEGIDQRVTPRVAAVWRINDRHALKSQYTEGFRSGTAGAENVFGRINDTLDFEVMRTAELQYIYRRPETAFKATLYLAEVDGRHQVDPSIAPGPVTVNIGSVDSQGLELEWWHQFGTRWRALANVSFQDTETKGSTAAMTDG
ncbi:MAG: TonB-dependent receptor, partial [Xanthomonadales bacterium]|nr:TonB-dependent receptor [Xanthomonadales bacterium]